jgi:sec-independent protein translocase protein TatA
MQNFADIFGLGTTELIIILVIVLLLFGAKKLPELSKSIGSSIKELRKGVSDEAKSENKKQQQNENS